MTAPNEQLAPSKLGTKAYWDDAYARELNNHAASSRDEGTVWFEDAGAEERVLAYLEEQECSGSSNEAPLRKSGEGATSFLDLGTGNGHMLFALREEGWEGRLVGVDYSGHSVELCKQIRDRRTKDAAGSAREGMAEGGGVDDGGEEAEGASGVNFGDLVFCQYDVFTSPAENPAAFPPGGFDVVLDKGTFDAVSLSDTTDANGKRIGEGYAAHVEPLVAAGGRLVVTSCNWTEAEIRRWFERPEGRLKYKERIKYPTFTFGGQTGSRICTVIFEKTP